VNCRNCKRLREFEEIEPQSKAGEVTVNSKEASSLGFCLDFVQEFGPWDSEQTNEGSRDRNRQKT
jgi:hypothetical protein